MRLSVLVGIFIASAAVMGLLFLAVSFFLSYHPAG